MVDVKRIGESLSRTGQLKQAVDEYSAASAALKELIESGALGGMSDELRRLVRQSPNPASGEALATLGLVQMASASTIVGAIRVIEELSRGHVATCDLRELERVHRETRTSLKQSLRASGSRINRRGPARRLADTVFVERPRLRDADFEQFVAAVEADPTHLWGEMIEARRTETDRWRIDSDAGAVFVDTKTLRRAWRAARQ